MTLESWIALAVPVLAAGGAWWCRTIWAEAKLARAEAAVAMAQIATIRLECVERDSQIWSALRTFQTEVARQYAGREEIQKLRDDLMGEFRRLEDKLDRLTER